MAPPETVFGHEFTGEIVSIGDDLVDGAFSVGDRITSLPFIEDKTIGLGAISGAYSEYVKVGYDLVVKLPGGSFRITIGTHWSSHSPWDSIPSKWQVKYEKSQYSSSEQAQLDSPVPYGLGFLAPNMSSAKWRRRGSPWPKPLASLTL